MSDRYRFDTAAELAGPADETADLRLGRYAIGLLQAARDTGDPALIALAETMAMAAGFALAAPRSDAGGLADS